MRRAPIVAAVALPLVLGACSSGTDKAARQVTFQATEYSFPGMQGFTTRQGETIEFVMTNTGTVDPTLAVSF